MAKHLTQPQRYYICLQIANNFTQTSIAKALDIDKSTVSREIKRNQRDINPKFRKILQLCFRNLGYMTSCS